MKREIYLYDHKILFAKFTTEEVRDGFISTTWLTTEELEEDRKVETYETFSAALAGMFENALNATIQRTADIRDTQIRMFGRLQRFKTRNDLYLR